MEADRSVLTIVRVGETVELDKERSSMLPPLWFVTAAISEVKTLLERFSQSAVGPSFFKTSLVISTVVPVERGEQISFILDPSPEYREVRYGGGEGLHWIQGSRCLR